MDCFVSIVDLMPFIMEEKAYIQFLFDDVKEWYVTNAIVGLYGLGVMCLPRDPRFAGSNPAEVDGFFQDVKILRTSPPGKNRHLSKI